MTGAVGYDEWVCISSLEDDAFRILTVRLGTKRVNRGFCGLTEGKN